MTRLTAPAAGTVGDRGEVVAAGTRNSTVVVLDAGHGALLADVRLVAPVSAIAFAGAGRLLIGTDRGLACIRFPGGGQDRP